MSRKDDFSITFGSLNEIQKALGELGPDAVPALSKANRVVAKKIALSAIIRAAPVDGGALSADGAWKIKVSSSKRRGESEVKIGVDPSYSETYVVQARGGGVRRKRVTPARYLHLVELGHAKGAGKGAAAANPFVRPTFERKRERMEKAFIDAMGPSIEKTWKTIRRRAARKAKG